MAAIKPIKVSSTGELQVFQTGDFVDIPNGGTGAITAAGARTALGLAIGSAVQAWSAGLDAFSTLGAAAGTGIIAQTGVNTFVDRTLTGSTRVSVTNGSGVAGNPTFDLSTYADSGVGSLLKLTRDSQGLISGTTAVTAADIGGLVDTRYLRTDGSATTMSAGFLTLFQDPTNPLHAATKQYVDLIAQGMVQKTTARVATAAALPTVTYANGTAGVGATLTASAVGILTVDGVATLINNYILVKDQASAFQNGLYKVTTAGTAGVAFVLTRATEMDSSGEFTGAFIPVDNEGTANANTLWLNNYTTGFVVGTTAVTLTKLNGATALTAGNGISISANIISATLAARLAFNGTNIDLATLTITGWANATTFYTKAKYDTYGRVIEVTQATAADVGAQASSSELTGLAALAANGIVVRTSAGGYTPRTLTGSAYITITNGDGVAGNPTFSMPTSGIVAGTYAGITFNDRGIATSATAGSPTAVTSDSFTNGEASAIAIGRAVYVSASDTVRLANANAVGTKDVVGLVSATSIASAAAGGIAADGFLAATTGQWDAVTGQSGGLTFGAKYFLSNTTAGALTTTAPTSGYIAPVGIAMSTTKMRVMISPTVLN